MILAIGKSKGAQVAGADSGRTQVYPRLMEGERCISIIIPGKYATFTLNKIYMVTGASPVGHGPKGQKQNLAVRARKSVLGQLQTLLTDDH